MTTPDPTAPESAEKCIPKSRTINSISLDYRATSRTMPRLNNGTECHLATTAIQLRRESHEVSASAVFAGATAPPGAACHPRAAVAGQVQPGGRPASHWVAQRRPGAAARPPARSADEPIPVAIETPRGLLVAALRAAGRPVYPINPPAVARYRDRHPAHRRPRASNSARRHRPRPRDHRPGPGSPPAGSGRSERSATHRAPISTTSDDAKPTATAMPPLYAICSIASSAACTNA